MLSGSVIKGRRDFAEVGKSMERYKLSLLNSGMTQDEIIEMVMQIGGCDKPEYDSPALKIFESFAKLVAQHEREACEALHDHEDVQAPIGNSSWGEAYQEGWAQGTAAYLEAIRARGQA